MFTFEKQKKKFRAWARREIAKEAKATMLTYQAARQSLDLYEMRLETLDTRLCKRVRLLEARVAELEATLSLYADSKIRTEAGVPDEATPALAPPAEIAGEPIRIDRKAG